MTLSSHERNIWAAQPVKLSCGPFGGPRRNFTGWAGRTVMTTPSMTVLCLICQGKTKQKSGARTLKSEVDMEEKVFKMNDWTWTARDLRGQTSPGAVCQFFEEIAFKMDRKYFGLSTAVSSIFHQSRARWDYDFTGSNFEWRAIATNGTGNGGYFVPVRPKTESARHLFRQRNSILQFQFERLDLGAMIRAKARFFELIDILYDVYSWYGAGRSCWSGFSWLHWDGDTWLSHFAFMPLHSWRDVRNNAHEVGEIADRCGSIPRLNDLQKLIKAGMCL